MERSDYPFVDLALARRLERAEGAANAGSVEARARVRPESGAAWIEVGGAYAMFDGPLSPLTQTFGLGLFEETTAAHLDAIEAFFRERSAPVFHEVSPLAHAGLPSLLGARGYRPVEFTSVMFRPVQLPRGIDAPPTPPSACVVRLASLDEQDIWCATAAAGWSGSPEVEEFMRDVGTVTVQAEGAHCFFAELQGRPVATGVLRLHQGIALLAGASTVPHWRGRGAQFALLDARLRYAAAQGCDLAMMCALPGSASQRNAERHAFRIAYTRVKWGR